MSRQSPANRLITIFAAAALVLLPAVASSGHESQSHGVTVAHPWLRATPAGATIGAAYLEIKTNDQTTDRLVSATSPAAGRVEIHTHTMDDGVMRMRKLDGIDLKAGESHVLKPSGDHIMLFDLKQPLVEGDTTSLTLTFEKAGPITVDASVEAVGAMGPHGFDSQPVDGKSSDEIPGKTQDHSTHQ